MRICPECGIQMKEVAKLKAGFNRRYIHRYQCGDCKFEQSFTSKEEEEMKVERDLREAEKENRKQITYNKEG